MGDIGCYTLGVMPPAERHGPDMSVWAPPVPRLHGFNQGLGEKSDEKHSVAVIGDSTFMPIRA